jgi:caa(3)-type oxidase subunit IV
MKGTNDPHHHITPASRLLATFFALVLLMLATVAVAYINMPPLLANIFNLGIAVIKATLVVSIFMGVWWNTKLTKMWALTGFIWLSLMSIIFGDYVTRDMEPRKGWYTQDTDWVPTESQAKSPLAAERTKQVEVGDSGAPPIKNRTEKP